MFMSLGINIGVAIITFTFRLLITFYKNETTVHFLATRSLVFGVWTLHFQLYQQQNVRFHKFLIDYFKYGSLTWLRSKNVLQKLISVLCFKWSIHIFNTFALFSCFYLLTHDPHTSISKLLLVGISWLRIYQNNLILQIRTCMHNNFFKCIILW